MTLILDTDEHVERDRAGALREAMHEAGVPANVTPYEGVPVRARMNLWHLDRCGTTLMHRIGTGLRLERTERQVKAAAPERVGLTWLSPSKWVFRQHDVDHAASGCEPNLLLVNQAHTYDHRRWDYGTTIAVNVDRSVLDVSMDTVIRASQNLNSASSLYALASSYLVSLCRMGNSSPHSLESSGDTTIELIRALVLAVADDGRRDALAQSLVVRIRMYIDKHLVDPELNAERIAADHHISMRHLYNAWSAEDTTLAEWIMHRRLELASRRLADPSAAHQTAAAVGRSCGFIDATHFGRRFRGAYGMTPGEWSRAHSPN